MKNHFLIIAVVLGVATLAYVAFSGATNGYSTAPLIGLETQNKQLTELVGDVTNAADNLEHSLKVSTSPGSIKRAGDGEIAELLRIVGDLNKVNAAQQQTIRDLLVAPKKDSGAMEYIVTLVGLGSTLLTMWLAWRKDRREIDELRAKLAELVPVNPAAKH